MGEAMKAHQVAVCGASTCERKKEDRAAPREHAILCSPKDVGFGGSTSSLVGAVVCTCIN